MSGTANKLHGSMARHGTARHNSFLTFDFACIHSLQVAQKLDAIKKEYNHAILVETERMLLGVVIDGVSWADLTPAAKLVYANGG